MFQKLVQLFLQKFVKNMGRGPNTPFEWMEIQNEAVRMLNKTKGVPSGPKKPPFQGWKPKIIEGGKKPAEGIPNLLESGKITLGKTPKTKKITLDSKKEKLQAKIEEELWIKRKQAENKEAVDRWNKKFGKKDRSNPFEDIKPKGDPDWDPDSSGMASGGLAPLMGEPTYGRIGLAGGGAGLPPISVSELIGPSLPSKNTPTGTPSGQYLSSKLGSSKPMARVEKPNMVGPPYEASKPREAIREIVRRATGSGVAGVPIGGDVSLNFPYGTNREYDFGIGYNTSSGDGISGGYAVNVGGDDIMGAAYNSPGGTFSAGVNKKEGSKPEFRLGFKKKFAKGGKAWQPKSAPKLTTTIPPERGPTPHGLTYLTGDDIVKHRIG